jgi:hypothetical protein
MIPMNPDSVAAGHPETHDCPQYRLEDTTTTTTTTAPRYLKCKSCNYDIYFDEKQKSDSGKFIPISRLTNKPHQCKATSKEYHPEEWNAERVAEATAVGAVVNKANEGETNKQ